MKFEDDGVTMYQLKTTLEKINPSGGTGNHDDGIKIKNSVVRQFAIIFKEFYKVQVALPIFLC